MKKVYINLKFSIEWIALIVFLIFFWTLILYLTFNSLDFIGLLIYIIVTSTIVILSFIVLIFNCFHKVILFKNILIYKTICTKKTIDINSVIEVKKVKERVFTTIFLKVPTMEEFVMISDGTQKIFLPVQTYFELHLNLKDEL